MKQTFIRTSLLGAVTGVAALVAMALAQGGWSGGSDATPGTSKMTASPNSNSPGFMVAKDPATGQLRAPTAEEMAALQSAKSDSKREGAALRSERLPNGAVVTTLDRSYDLYEVASKDSNGKIHEACVPAFQLEAVMQATQNSDLTKKEALDEK